MSVEGLLCLTRLLIANILIRNKHRTPPPPPRQHSICNRSRQLTAVTHRPPLAQRDEAHSGPQASPLPGGTAGSGRALPDERQRPAGPAPPGPARPGASAPRLVPAMPRPAQGPPWPQPGCNGGKPTKQPPPPAAAHGEEQRAQPLPAAPERPLPARSVSPAAAGPSRAGPSGDAALHSAAATCAAGRDRRQRPRSLVGRRAASPWRRRRLGG